MTADIYDPRLAEARGALARIRAGATAGDVETETLDCKEDPTRRSPDGALRPGATEDDDAARFFAPEAACLANHEGGALVVGVDDKAAGPAALIGTALDAGWLRHRIRELTSPPLSVGVHEVSSDGTRVLVLVIPRNGGSEPHSAVVSKNRGRRTPRRIGTSCYDMETVKDLVEWSQERRGFDWSAAPSGISTDDARPTAIEALRDFLRESGEPNRVELAEATTTDLLRRLQLLRDDGTLNRAGALLLCPGTSPRLQYLRRRAPGLPSRIHKDVSAGGLAEELRHVLQTVDVVNRRVTLPSGNARGVVQAIPPTAVREALVNAVMHRDWEIPEPIVVDHASDEIMIFSPGDLFGGLTVDTLLTAPSRTRNRTLGDALRSLRLAEREGTGVDRMYVDMIRLGHRPPDFVERDGGVRVVLQGGEPLPEVLRMHASLPHDLRESPRMAVALDLLRRHVSITADELGEAAQEPGTELLPFLKRGEDAGILIRTAHPRSVGVPAWRLADAVRDQLGDTLPYVGRPAAESIQLIADVAWELGEVRNRDVQDLLNVNSVRASELLKQAEKAGLIALHPDAKPRGRSVRYIPSR